MKSKMLTLGAFFVILMLLSLNTAWAHDPMPKHRSNGSQGYGVQKHGEQYKYNKHKNDSYLNKEKRRFEKAKRRAWADGKLTYREMRKLHKFQQKARRDIHQRKHHRRYHHPVMKRNKHYRHDWSAYPMFTLHFSFSDPGTLFTGSIGVK